MVPPSGAPSAVPRSLGVRLRRRAAVGLGSGHALRRLRPKARTTIAAVAAADRVITGNDLLADWASGLACDVVTIPSCVDSADDEAKTSWAVHDPPRLGWLGSPPTEVYLPTVTDALLEVHRRTGARLTIVSRGTRSLGSLDAIVDRVQWSPDVARSLPATWDCGLMPMTNGLFDRAKCGYKLLQYAAAGLPAIASPVGVNAVLLSAFGAPAPLDQGEWVDALTTLLAAGDADRVAMAARALAVVNVEYSYDCWRSAWLAAVRPG